MKKLLTIFLCLLLLLQVSGSLGNAVAVAESTPPVTTANISGSAGTNGIYYGTVQLQLTAYDGESGISVIQYSLDDGTTWLTYSGPVSFSAFKWYSIVYRAIDNDNNIEPSRTIEFAIKADKIPPTTSAQLSGPAGDNSYYKGPVQVSLLGEDGQSGVLVTEFSLNGGQSWEPYVAPLGVTDSGISTIYFRSKDKGGNVEKAKKLKVNIDDVPSASPGFALSPSTWTNGDQTLEIFNGSDLGSGPRKSQYRLVSDGANDLLGDSAGQQSPCQHAYQDAAEDDQEQLHAHRSAGVQQPKRVGSFFPNGSGVPNIGIIIFGIGNLNQLLSQFTGRL